MFLQVSPRDGRHCPISLQEGVSSPFSLHIEEASAVQGFSQASSLSRSLVAEADFLKLPGLVSDPFALVQMSPAEAKTNWRRVVLNFIFLGVTDWSLFNEEWEEVIMNPD